VVVEMAGLELAIDFTSMFVDLASVSGIGSSIFIFLVE